VSVWSESHIEVLRAHQLIMLLIAQAVVNFVISFMSSSSKALPNRWN
jgi:hypothetical protein